MRFGALFGSDSDLSGRDRGQTSPSSVFSPNAKGRAQFSCGRERSVTQQGRWRVWGTVRVRVAAAGMEGRGRPKRW